MKIRRQVGTATGGVPAQMGGYNYSTDKSQNTLFNQGLTPGDPGAGAASYDYSAKGRADRMYQMTGNPRPTQANLSQTGYGTDQVNANKLRRISRALGKK